MPGAFRKTLKEGGTRVRHLWQHDVFSPPVATILEVREVGERQLPDSIRDVYTNATGGLLVKREYLDTPRGNEVLAGLTSEPPAITEMSFGFDVVKFEYVQHAKADEVPGFQVRNLREVKLYDTSDVLWGANPATANLKSLAALDGRLTHLQAVIAPLLLPDAIKASADLSEGRLAELKAALATIESILAAAEPPIADDTAMQALTEALRVRLGLAEREFALIGA
jgi:HK97 family phage prohead protease